MTRFLLLLAALILQWREVRASEDSLLRPPITIADELQMFYVKNNYYYAVQRIGFLFRGVGGYDKRAAVPRLRLYKAPLSKMGKTLCFELHDSAVIVIPTIFLRWRLSPSDYFWGTERSFDDRSTGIFRHPLRILKPLQANIGGGKNPDPHEAWDFGLYNYMGGSDMIGTIAASYWWRSRVGHDATGIQLTSKRWPKGLKGMYFDFVPMSDEQKILLFILFNRECLEFSSDPDAHRTNNIIEIWECEKGIKDQHYQDGTFDGTHDLPDDPKRTPDLTDPLKEVRPVKDLKKGWIETTMADPFYAFEKDGDYFFATITGKIFIAPRPREVDPNAIERLLTQLDSDTFSIRDKASRELRAIGKPAQEILENHLPKATSPEQKRRLTDLIKAVKDQPHRKTRLLWDHAKLPVYRLLFDMDHRKIYAITKSDANKRQYFLEIQDKPQRRLLTLPKESKAPSSLPESARLFYDFARSLRNEK